MKIKKNLIFALMSIGYNMMAQVGVYTKDPKVSMEIQKVNDTKLPADGFLLPRLTVSELENSATRYSADQHGTLIYVVDGPGTGPSTSEILIPGFYYFNSSL